MVRISYTNVRKRKKQKKIERTDRMMLLVFSLSGAAALIYEIVWSRSLQFIFGSTIQTASAIFSAFLLGFSLGILSVQKYLRYYWSAIEIYSNFRNHYRCIRFSDAFVHMAVIRGIQVGSGFHCP